MRCRRPLTLILAIPVGSIDSDRCILVHPREVVYFFLASKRAAVYVKALQACQLRFVPGRVYLRTRERFYRALRHRAALDLARLIEPRFVRVADGVYARLEECRDTDLAAHMIGMVVG